MIDVTVELGSLAIDLDMMHADPTPVCDVNPDTLIVLNSMMRDAMGGKENRDLRLELVEQMTYRWPVLSTRSFGVLTSTKDLTFSACMALIAWLKEEDSDPPVLREGAREAIVALMYGTAVMP
jgi:hypothetical protein